MRNCVSTSITSRSPTSRWGVCSESGVAAGVGFGAEHVEILSGEVRVHRGSMTCTHTRRRVPVPAFRDCSLVRLFAFTSGGRTSVPGSVGHGDRRSCRNVGTAPVARLPRAHRTRRATRRAAWRNGNDHIAEYKFERAASYRLTISGHAPDTEKGRARRGRVGRPQQASGPSPFGGTPIRRRLAPMAKSVKARCPSAGRVGRGQGWQPKPSAPVR